MPTNAHSPLSALPDLVDELIVRPAEDATARGLSALLLRQSPLKPVMHFRV